MMSNQTNVLLSLICLLLVGHSWYVHYVVKDGLARLMLLWGCGFLFTFLFNRIVIFLLADMSIINSFQAKMLTGYNVWFIYAIIIGQYFIQRGGAQRKEGVKFLKDKKELASRRKDDKEA